MYIVPSYVNYHYAEKRTLTKGYIIRLKSDYLYLCINYYSFCELAKHSCTI